MPPMVVTVMWTAPAAAAGEVTVSEVVLVTLTVVPAVAPKAPVEPERKPDPVTVTTVPPASGPLTGATPEMAGAPS